MNSDLDLDNNATKSGPWYKEGWMWLVVSIPAAAVILGLSMVYFAVMNPHSMVSDDYYKEGLAINRKLQLDRQARVWGLKGEVQLEGKTLFLHFDKPLPVMHQALTLKAIHPTIAEKDQTLVLTSNDQQRFVGLFANPLEKAHYKLHIISNQHQWRLKASMNTRQAQGKYAVDAFDTPF